MSNLRGPELLIIVILLVLVFGARRMPDAARSLGRSLRIFRAETKGMLDGEPESQPAVADPIPAPEVAATEPVAQNPVVPPTARM